MNGPQVTYRQMLERLQNEGLLTAQQLLLAEDALTKKREHTPAFAGLMMGIGAWLAGLFFTGFLLILFYQLHIEKSGIALAGLGYLFSATMLRRSARHLFFIQAALALALTGYLMAIFSITDLGSYSDRGLTSAVVSTLLAVLVCWVNPCPILRFMLPLIATFFVLVWLVYDDLPFGMCILALAQVLALTLILIRYRNQPGLHILSHSLLMALALALGELFYHGAHATGMYSLFYNHYSSLSYLWREVDYISTFLFVAWLLWVVRWFARHLLLGSERDHWHHYPMARAGLLACVLLAVFANSGVVVFTGMLLLGYGLQERYIFQGALALLALSMGYLFVELHRQFLGNFQTPLALIASGVIFLGVRAWMRHCLRQNSASQPIEQPDSGNFSRVRQGLIWGGAALLFLLLNVMAICRSLL